jgi:hypothetical protein
MSVASFSSATYVGLPPPQKTNYSRYVLPSVQSAGNIPGYHSLFSMVWTNVPILCCVAGLTQASLFTPHIRLFPNNSYILRTCLLLFSTFWTNISNFLGFAGLTQNLA